MLELNEITRDQIASLLSEDDAVSIRKDDIATLLNESKKVFSYRYFSNTFQIFKSDIINCLKNKGINFDSISGVILFFPDGADYSMDKIGTVIDIFQLNYNCYVAWGTGPAAPKKRFHFRFRKRIKPLKVYFMIGEK